MIQQFVTEEGILVPAVATEQMRAIDRIAMEETGPNLFQMMENAGRNLAEMAMRLMAGRWKKACYLILAGSGGNGGGGICAGRHLANRGLNVWLCLSRTENLKEITTFQYNLYQQSGGNITTVDNLHRITPDIIIDAIIGYSLTSIPTGSASKMISWANSCSSIKLSLDVPSGVDATSGEGVGLFFQADATLTLALPKSGLYPHKTGKLYLADIGIPAIVYQMLGLKYTPPFGNRYIVELTLPSLAQAETNFHSSS